MDGGAEPQHLKRVTLLSPCRPFNVMYLTICANVPQGGDGIMHGPPVTKKMPKAQEGLDLVATLDPALIVVTGGGASKRVESGLPVCRIESVDNVNFQDSLQVAI